jgi:hypothetical protein
MTNKVPFCAFLWLTLSVLSRQIRSLPAYQVILWSLPTYQVGLWSLPTFQLGPRNLFTPLETCLLFLMGCNPRLIKDLYLYNCRDKTTDVMSALQIHLFLQNEPNFQKSQVNVTAFITKDYEQMDTWSIQKNEPKTNPNEPKTNPILANKKPIRTQTNPKQTQFILS